MQTFDQVSIQFVIVLAFIGACLWVVLAFMIEVMRTLGHANHRLCPTPRWLRVMAVSIASFFSTPRLAAAETGETRQAAERSDGGSGFSGLVLGSSIAANAVFAGIHLRRQLASVRKEKFSKGHVGKAMPSSPAAELQPPPEWDLVVRVLGTPVIETRCGVRVPFERGKALELLVWMVEHREASTRSAARTALWDGVVKDSTFSNVVSEARRALNSVSPRTEDEWIPRTFTDELPLAPGIVTDAEILDVALQRFVSQPEENLAHLVEILSGVRNLPFAGADYAWADGEGITTSHVIKVVKAAVLVGEYAIARNDNDLLFMATERGLRVLPGHEELVSLRMKGHARCGNRTAIKCEWESYARAVEADSWAGVAPSPELEELARELSKP